MVKVLQHTVAKQFSVHCAFINAMAVLPLSLCCHCWCHGHFYLPPTPDDCCMLLSYGTITMLWFHCYCAMLPLPLFFLLALLPVVDCCFPRKFLRHHHWLNCTSCCNAATIVPQWWCCCCCAMLPCFCWLSGTVAAGWLLFFNIFKSWNTITSTVQVTGTTFVPLYLDAGAIA